MPRRVRNTHLETRSARAKLAPRRNPYWQRLADGLHLGYVPRRGGGKWVARFYLGGVAHEYRGRSTIRNYEKRVIGEADDHADADGLTALSYDQASAMARRLHAQRAHAEAGTIHHEGAYTVAHAVEDYAAYLEATGRPAAAVDVRKRIRVFAQPLWNVEVTKLTSDRLRKFLADLAAQPARKRPASDGRVQYRATRDERARRNTANRYFAMLRAALNHAYDEKRVASNDAWGRRVKPFRAVEGKRDRILSIDEARRLINACHHARFRDLVQAALMTGCRFSELTRLVASDFKNGTVHVRRSKSGKERYVVLADEGVALFAGLCQGRRGDERVLPFTSQRRLLIEALKRAAITPPITFHGLRHTYASHAIMNGVPLIVVAANLGHGDTRMIERHYGHLARSYVADAIRAGAPTFGTVTPGNVRGLRE
jgi:integrase